MLSRFKAAAGFVGFGLAFAAQQPTFKSSVKEVRVPVSVLCKGKPVEALNVEDFTVLDNGERQTINLVDRDWDILPMRVVVVVQTSDLALLAKTQKAGGVIDNYVIGEGGQAALMTTGDGVHLKLDFTSDQPLFASALKRLQADGGPGPINDAVIAACDLLTAHKERSRKAILLITETRDHGSKTHFAEALVKAQQNDIAIYSISYSPMLIPFTQKASEIPEAPDSPGSYDPPIYNPTPGGAMQNPPVGISGIGVMVLPMLIREMAKKNVSEAYAKSTGGDHDFSNTLKRLETELIDFGTEMHNQYTLTFVPTNAKPGYHTLDVKVRGSSDWKVRARAGYWIGE